MNKTPISNSVAPLARRDRLRHRINRRRSSIALWKPNLVANGLNRVVFPKRALELADWGVGACKPLGDAASGLFQSKISNFPNLQVAFQWAAST